MNISQHKSALSPPSGRPARPRQPRARPERAARPAEPSWPPGLRFPDDPGEARKRHAPDPRWPRSPYPARATIRTTAASCADQGEEDTQ